VLKNILVPLDGSPLSETALPYAEALAQRTGASLTLVRAAHKPVAPLGDVAIDMQRAVMDAEDYLDTLSEQLVKRGFDVQTGVPFGGSVAAWIIEEIDLRKVDLIVMATHDRVGPDRWVHGSVAETVVHRATIPVMLVRNVPADQSGLQAWNEPQPVLIVPLDGSELAEAALPSVKELARTLSARVVLLGVTLPPGELVATRGAVVPYVESDHAQVEANARAYLEEITDRVGTATASVDTSVRQGDPATEIAAAAREHSAAAVVMATHGRTGLVRSILGSVAGGVLHHSTVPVVLVHPKQIRVTEQSVVQQTAAVTC
jgi:nucleotide-binding universal stress UspA family protein